MKHYYFSASVNYVNYVSSLWYICITIDMNELLVHICALNFTLHFSVKCSGKYDELPVD